MNYTTVLVICEKKVKFNYKKFHEKPPHFQNCFTLQNINLSNQIDFPRFLPQKTKCPHFPKTLNSRNNPLSRQFLVTHNPQYTFQLETWKSASELWWGQRAIMPHGDVGENCKCLRYEDSEGRLEYCKVCNGQTSRSPKCGISVVMRDVFFVKKNVNRESG